MKMYKSIGFLFVAFIVSFLGCQEDDLEKGKNLEAEHLEVLNSLSVDDVKSWYDDKTRLKNKERHSRNGSESPSLTPFSLTPVWELNEASFVSQNTDGVFIAVKEASELSSEWADLMLMSYLDSVGEIRMTTVVLIYDSVYYAGIGERPNADNMTGLVFQVNGDGKLGIFLACHEGEIVDYGNANYFGLTDEGSSSDIYAFMDVGENLANRNNPGCGCCCGKSGLLLWLCQLAPYWCIDDEGGIESGKFQIRSGMAGVSINTGSSTPSEPIQEISSGGGGAGIQIDAPVDAQDFASHLDDEALQTYGEVLTHVNSELGQDFDLLELNFLTSPDCITAYADYLASFQFGTTMETEPSCLEEQLDNYNEALGDYYFELHQVEIAWLHQTNNETILENIETYIDGNTEYVDEEMLENIKTHIYLCQNYPYFLTENPSVGSEEWKNSIFVLLSNEFPNIEFEQTNDVTFPETNIEDFVNLVNYLDNLEQQGGSISIQGTKGASVSIWDDTQTPSIPKGIVTYKYKMLDGVLGNNTFWDSYIEFGFNYQNYPQVITDSDITNSYITYTQEIETLLYSTQAGSFTPSGPYTFQNGNNASPPLNVLVITYVGHMKIEGGLPHLKIGATMTKQVTAEFDMHMSSTINWVNGASDRFPYSEVHIQF